VSGAMVGCQVDGG